jgi:subtilisin family serine protease
LFYCLPWIDGEGYTWMSGTSMAAPHVAGAAALVWSRSDITTNRQVVDALRGSADPQGVDAVRLDTWTRHGGLNVHDALSYGLTNLSPVANAGPDQVVTDNDRDGGETVALDGTASFDSDGTIINHEWREGTTAVAVAPASSVWFSVGVHTLTLEVIDERGAVAVDTVVVTVNAAPEPPPDPGLRVTAIDPNVVSQSVGTRTFVIAGTGFAAGASVTFVNGSGPAPRVLSVTHNSSTQLTANVEIRPGGRRNRSFDVRVTNPDDPAAWEWGC